MKKKLNKKLYKYYLNNALHGSIIFDSKKITKINDQDYIAILKTDVDYCFYSINTFKNLRCNIPFDKNNNNDNILCSLESDESFYYIKYCVNIFNLLLLCMIYKKEV